MSDEPTQRVRSRSSFGSSPSSGSGRALRLPILALSAGIWVVALAEIGQSWEMATLASGYEPPGRLGDLVSATLVNGQVFFGTLDAASRTTIQLRDVFFAQATPPPARGAEPDTEQHPPVIVRRKDNEWTRSDLMAIPVERIAFMETVGNDSRIAHTVADARTRVPLPPIGPPKN